jgi:hypothetical protein
MKVTVKQLKALIREAAEEAMDEMKQEDEGMDMDEAAEEEAALHEAVSRAFRAGYQRGVKAATTRKVRR